MSMRETAPGAPGSRRAAAVGVRMVDLRRSYAGVNALDGLTLEVEPGEFISLLGPSGCGKTTALRLLAGLEAADGGSILVGGRDVTAVPASRRDMGMVFQAYSLFPNLTAADNVGFGLRLRRVSPQERRSRAGELLELVGLADQANRYPHQLSGGQQQRVALARALAIRPTVLLLDEPLSALDARVRVQLREEIRRIQTELQITTLFVTHDQEEALAISDRVGVMSAGRLEQLDTPARVYQQPATPFVAEFVGVTNSLTGTVTSSPIAAGEDSKRVTGSGTAPALRIGSGTVPATAVAPLPGGAAARVLVRPADIRLLLLPASPAAGAGGQLAAQVVAHSFLGPVTRVSVRLDGADSTVRVDVPSAAAGKYPPGCRVALEIDPAAAMLAAP